MTNCLRKGCSFGLLCMCFVNVNQSECILSLLDLRFDVRFDCFKT